VNATEAAWPLPTYTEIETSRKCNRTCSWCPNAEHTVRHEQELMDWGVFHDIAEQLGDARYAGWFAFHNYNEPLLNPRLGKEIRQVREAAPLARPAIYTNGDPLNRERLTELTDAGLAYIRITRYPRQAQTPPSYESIDAYLRRAGLSDLEFTRGRVRQGLGATAEHEGVRIEVISPNITATYNTRGGSVTTLPLLSRTRTAPCLMTATSLVVDYRGQVKMCCCIYPEAEQHAGYVIGNVREQRLLELWNSVAMNAYRRAHAAADWSLSPACASCTQPLPETRGRA
jgi:MoaA/NifB/PqqE/SkfB family radical SAM enzyme